jgi:hypothetical protein
MVTHPFENSNHSVSCELQPGNCIAVMVLSLQGRARSLLHVPVVHEKLHAQRKALVPLSSTFLLWLNEKLSASWKLEIWQPSHLNQV